MSGQIWNADAYAANGRFVADLATGVVDWLQPQAGERILDVGCGDGVLTQRLAQMGALMTGVDASEAMIERARDNGIDAHHTAVEAMRFPALYDAAFSNAALHWIPLQRQTAALEAIRAALKPGGRFVAEMGGQGNIAGIRVALQSVFAAHGIDAEKEAASCFPSPVEYTLLLRGAGFEVERIALIPRPTPLPNGMAEWLGTFRNALFAKLDAAASEAALKQTVALLKPVLCDVSGAWTADYVRLRFIARAV